MPSKSILELDEARRRLQQMTDEHGQLSELIAHLRKIRDNLTATLTETTTKLQDSEQQALEVEETVARASEEIEQFRTKAESTIARVASSGEEARTVLDALVEDTRRQVDGLLEQVAKARGELDAHLSAWSEKQERSFGGFREQHFKALKGVTEAYERAKTALESHGPLIDRLDAKVDKLIESHGETVASLRARIDGVASQTEKSVAEMRNASEEYQSLLMTRFDELSTRVTREVTELLQSTRESLGDEIASVKNDQAAQDKHVHVLRKRMRFARFVFWLILISMAAYACVSIYGQRAEIGRFWSSTFERVRQAIGW